MRPRSTVRRPKRKPRRSNIGSAAADSFLEIGGKRAKFLNLLFGGGLLEALSYEVSLAAAPHQHSESLFHHERRRTDIPKLILAPFDQSDKSVAL